MTLDQLSIGQSGVITAVGGEGALRFRLLDMGLIPGTRVMLQKVAPLGDPMELHVRGYQLTLRKEDAHRISIEPEETTK
ncbi:MAG: ferrous iron transport protein A [Clostridia bacterium]|nr:ferrous iron transport protein A [Clostridia bacterium]